MVNGKLKDHQLEKKLGDHERAVVVRRSLFERRVGRSMENLPVEVRCFPERSALGMTEKNTVLKVTACPVVELMANSPVSVGLLIGFESRQSRLIYIYFLPPPRKV